MGEPSPTARCKEDFAARLRELRAKAGSPSFRHLAKLTNYSSSTLADATSGRRLPTEPVLKALVTACGADPAPWLEELRRIAITGSADTSEADPPAAGKTRPGRRRLAFAAAGALAVFAAGLVVGRMVTPSAFAGEGSSADTVQQLPGVPPFSGTPTPAPAARVTDGIDPGVGHCDADRKVVDRAAVILDGVQVGSLDLLYSPRCGAGWAMIYLYPGQPTMMGEATVRSGDDRYTTMANPLVKQVDVYTDVIVPGPGGCLGAGGVVYAAGKPVVTAAIPCESPTAG